jgi:hypothetical protein
MGSLLRFVIGKFVIWRSEQNLLLCRVEMTKVTNSERLLANTP